MVVLWTFHELKKRDLFLPSCRCTFQRIEAFISTCEWIARQVHFACPFMHFKLFTCGIYMIKNMQKTTTLVVIWHLKSCCYDVWSDTVFMALYCFKFLFYTMGTNWSWRSFACIQSPRPLPCVNFYAPCNIILCFIYFISNNACWQQGEGLKPLACYSDAILREQQLHQYIKEHCILQLKYFSLPEVTSLQHSTVTHTVNIQIRELYGSFHLSIGKKINTCDVFCQGWYDWEITYCSSVNDAHRVRVSK